MAEQQASAYRDAGHEVTWVGTAPPLHPGVTHDDGIRRIRIGALNTLETRRSMPFPLIGPRGFRAVAAAVSAADLVHLHDCLYLPVLGADRAARRSGLPTIVTQHVEVVAFGTALDPMLRLAYRTVGRRVLRRATTVAFVSEHVRTWFADHVDPDIRGVVIPNAVDTRRFRPGDAAERALARTDLGLPPDQPVIAFVGRLVPKKGLAALVAGVARLPDVRLLVVGDGTERGAMDVLGARVTHLPQLPPGRMPLVYRAADVFALLSRGEGMPVALIEALASGLPAIVSDDPGFAALAGCDGVTRVRPEAATVATAIGSLLADPAAHAAQGRAARAWALERHAPAAFADRYLALAEAALAAPRVRTGRTTT